MALSMEKHIEELLSSELHYLSVVKVKDVTGGLVNKASLYETNEGKIFVKYAERKVAEDMFKAEETSLQLFDRIGIIRVPHPIKVLPLPNGGAAFVMEYLEGLEPMKSRWGELGQKMARLHRHNADLLAAAALQDSSVHNAQVAAPVSSFGFHTSTFYGSEFSTPPGVWCQSWPEYFARHLLQPQFEMIEKKYRDQELRVLWAELQLVLHKAFHNLHIQPALLHGDFCAINVAEHEDQVVTFDPMCSYGHSEFDLTIVEMEKNYGEDFKKCYDQVLPESRGYSTRMKLYHTFACLLISLVPMEVDLRNEAKKSIREFLTAVNNDKT